MFISIAFLIFSGIVLGLVFEEHGQSNLEQAKEESRSIETACGCGYPFGGGTAEGSKRGQALMPSGACFFRAWSRFALCPIRRMRPCEKPCQT